MSEATALVVPLPCALPHGTSNACLGRIVLIAAIDLGLPVNRLIGDRFRLEEGGPRKLLLFAGSLRCLEVSVPLGFEFSFEGAAGVMISVGRGRTRTDTG